MFCSAIAIHLILLLILDASNIYFSTSHFSFLCRYIILFIHSGALLLFTCFNDRIVLTCSGDRYVIPSWGVQSVRLVRGHWVKYFSSIFHRFLDQCLFLPRLSRFWYLSLVLVWGYRHHLYDREIFWWLLLESCNTLITLFVILWLSASCN